MDHHDDWGQWHHEDGQGDTADLGGDHDLGSHDLGGHEHDLGGYDDEPGHDMHDVSDHDGVPAPDHDDLTPAPDLVHEGGDGDLGHDIGHDAHDISHDDGHDVHDVEDQPAPADHLVGADPDLPGDPDGTWHDGDFPPALDLDVRPEPADGYPWADPGTLGDVPDGYGLDDHTALTATGSAAPGDLFAYAGIDPPAPGTDPWAHLLGSDDPATSSLARFWGPSLG